MVDATIDGLELLEPIELNLLRPEFRSDPRPLFHAMRNREPVYWSCSLGMWLVTGYRAAVTVLRDPRFGKRDYWERLAPERSGSNGAAVRIVRRWISQLDPPEHTLLRRTLAGPLSARAVKTLEPRIEHVAKELLADLAGKSSTDIIASYAFRLPAAIICDLLDAPHPEYDLFKKWSEALVYLFDPIMSVDQVEEANVAAAAFYEYCVRLLKVRCRASSGRAILDEVATAVADGLITDFDAAANIMFLVFAGHGTTTMLIGNAILSLLRHPDQLDLLRREPGLVGQCVEEVLRYEGPVQITSRIAIDDVVLAGRRIRRGQQLVTLDGAVNCDPERYENPERFDIMRRGRGHVAFGGGAHTCLGAALARVETAIAIRTLLDAFPCIELLDRSIAWGQRAFLRGPTSLTLKCS